MKTAKERFEEKYIPVTESGCWLWTGATTAGGYGQFRDGPTMAYAHRWAYEHFMGPIPGILYVCHRCDVPSCVNPAHLFLGTSGDNSHDMVEKGRQARVRGSKHPLAKLTDKQVLAIRQAAGTQREIAARFGISPQHVGRIRRRAFWTHLG